MTLSSGARSIMWNSTSKDSIIDYRKSALTHKLTEI